MRLCLYHVRDIKHYSLELLEGGDLPIVLFLTLPCVYIINCQSINPLIPGILLEGLDKSSVTSGVLPEGMKLSRAGFE